MILQFLSNFIKTNKGCFFGIKLHLLINEQYKIQGLKLTKENVDDRTNVSKLINYITGLLFSDKSYLK
ncbi:transposase DDE domain protein [Orientia chuto str. Dubai]|uniref:Transposase DDE domain protein n=1 Tax=Orientia chuto str. Dubai TaxID=1359168 RepID=A0A0F3MMI4_9RICK|nr:transposase DDE domain protein [Orientia chuto str. Dubai]